ncbi:MAG: hypothetical protein AAFR84_01940 [Pseudomonadota bacterium]
MEVYPSGVAVLLLWAAIALKPDRGLMFAIACVPLGMFAAFKLPIGGMTPLMAQMTAAGSIALLCLHHLMQRRSEVHAPPAALPLMIFAGYAVFASVFLVRIFEGEFMVFSMSRGDFGIRVSHLFPATLTPLRPAPANISQTAYLLLSVAFFLAVADVARRRGYSVLISALRVAAIVNIVFGILDLLQLDALLSVVRTASYILHNDHAISGIPRVIGAFPEASGFGHLSAVLAAFFLFLGVERKSTSDMAIGAISALFAALALSSTSFVGLGMIALVFALRAAASVLLTLDRTMTLVLVAFGGISLAALSIGILAVEIHGGGVGAKILNELIFSKSTSTSGLERGALALGGFQAFVDTYGLGAGVGSVRANGYVSALVAAVGVPGVIMALWFVAAAFGKGAPRVAPQQVARMGENVAPREAISACRGAAIVLFAMAAVSSMSVDPGLVLMTLAAISTTAAHVPVTAASARQPAPRRTAALRPAI